MLRGFHLGFVVRGAGEIIRKHLVSGDLSSRAIADISESDLQAWLNGYVPACVSRSLLKCLLMHTRAIWKHARKKKIVAENPTEDLRAKWKKRPSERALSMDECRLLSAVVGRDPLIIRIFIQLGAHPEELFPLCRGDIMGCRLRIDEAIVEGKAAPVKTNASDDCVYVPPYLQTELNARRRRSAPG